MSLVTIEFEITETHANFVDKYRIRETVGNLSELEWQLEEISCRLTDNQLVEAIRYYNCVEVDNPNDYLK